MSAQLTEDARRYLASIGRKGGKLGGKSTSKQKQAAARRNGKLGGRPRKQLTTSKATN